VRYTYSDRPTLPARIYCDTSFLLDVFASRYPPVSLDPVKRARAHDAGAFLTWGRSQGTTFCTSLLAFQEAFQRLQFAEILKRSGNWKQFRSSNPADFAALLHRGRRTARKFVRSLDGEGIQTLEFGIGELVNTLLRERLVVRYARQILRRYGIDSADAFQYVLARRAGILAAVSSDADWANLPFDPIITSA
jgi:predicted nucleic acid-binding protein